MAISRRNFIKNLSSSAYVLSQGSPNAVGSTFLTPSEQAADIFVHGVASGDPLIDRVIIWTRVSGYQFPQRVTVRWQVAFDRDFRYLAAAGEQITSSDRDFTVKEDVHLPNDGQIYYYRFCVDGHWSMTGRTRTLPRNSEHIRLAVCACSSIWSGYMNAYDRLAEKNDIDLIIHCGDYIYEAPDSQELIFMPPNALDRSQPENLSQIRRRYAYYRQNPSLKRAHQQHPFSIIWDNHDLAVKGGALGTAAAQRAFHEWVPIRSPSKNDPRLIYRKLSLGDLVDIFLLDTRSIGRDTIWPESSDLSLLGAEQFQWLQENLTNSKAHWKIIASQVLMAPFKIAAHPLTKTTWDGYPEERKRLFDMIRDHNIQNTIVVSGDAHISFANDLLDEQNNPIAVEFLPSSVSRGNVDEIFRGFFAQIIGTSFEKLIRTFNPGTRYIESFSSGYGIVDLQRDKGQCEFWYTNIEEPDCEQRLGAAFEIPANMNQLKMLSSPKVSQRTPEPLAPPDENYFIKTPLIGGSGGNFFSEENWAINYDIKKIKSIELRGQKRLEGIRLVRDLDGNELSYFGNSTLPPLRLILNEDEKVVKIQISTGKYRHSKRVFYLSLLTNLGQHVHIGTKTTEVQTIEIPDGWYLTGIEGRSGRAIDALGFILRSMLFKPS